MHNVLLCWVGRFIFRNMAEQKNVIGGRNAVIEALKSNEQLEKILLYKNATGEAIEEIRQLAGKKSVQLQYVPNEKLNHYTGIHHQGVVALKASVVYYSLDEILQEVTSSNKKSLFLMLDGITDIRNIGAIARSAYCYGVDAIIIPDKGVGSLNADAVKTSAGALNHLKVCRVNSLLKAIDSLHALEIKVYASEMKASKKLADLTFDESCCFIMGSEEKGIQHYLLKAADEKFSIPMHGNFDSLNVSVATGILLYECFKQRTSIGI